jgi:hypothetical protein
MKDFLLDMAIVAVVLVIALPFAVKSCEPKVDDVVECDTIYIHDTIRIVEPIHIKETVVRYDTVFFPVYKELDSISNLTQDSAKVVVPITERTYEDSTYKAVVRGYNPELVSLDMYLKEVYFPKIVEMKVKPKVVVSAGVYGGFGVKGADYGLCISVGVPIWSWYD